MGKSHSGIIIIFMLLGLATYMLLCRYDISKIVLMDCKDELMVNANNVKGTERWFVTEFLPILAIDYDPQESDSLATISMGQGDKTASATDSDKDKKENSDKKNTEENHQDSIDKIDIAEENATEAVAIPNNQGIVYSMDQLMDYEFLLDNCYTVDKSTSVNPDEINAENLLSKDMSIDISSKEYKVLIYHTHGSESFIDSRPGVTEDTVIGMGDELTRILEEDYGIKTYHDRTVYDMVDGELDRSYAYDLSGQAARELLEQYPSIEVVIDLHRDGVREDLHLVRVINGKPTAQIMFFNGVSRLNVNGDVESMYNPNKIDNLGFSLQLHLSGKRMYGDLMRRIYISGYRYNLDILPRATLIEVGAQTNTVEEEKNAMIPLAAILNDVLSGNNKRN
ncbi:MAG: stage II sporulation protein P [Clostridium sp.]|nr:stage II sporulation protein P [Clostridium sp.]MCM1398685.1 stage II sporulation protein P [Clostridium sp.]MCM1458684.1 stage II sporulation protein P [Bacteroides sp.]